MKKFLQKAILLCAPAILFSAVYCGLCCYTDIYNVFHWENMRFTEAEPNHNYIKTKLMLKNPRGFNAFMFGNSRVGFIPVEFLEQTEGAANKGAVTDKDDTTASLSSRLPDENLFWFNMAYSMGVPREHLQTLQTFVQNGVTVKRIYVGIDNNSCAIDPREHTDDLKRRPYQVFAADRTKLLDYFFCFDKGQFAKIRALDWAANRREQQHFYANGGQIYDASRGESGKTLKPDGYEGYVYKDVIDDIRALKSFCRAHKIDVVFFVNPLWHETYTNACAAGYLEFLADCAEVTDFVSFAGVFDFTKDSANFYEASHFRTNIGRAVADVLAQNKGANDFCADSLWGMHVTAQNKAEYIDLLRQNLFR